MTGERKLLWLALSVLLLVPAAASSNEVVIISSSIASVRSGDVLPGSTPVQLKLGEHVHVLDSRGNVFRLEGPFAGELIPTEAVEPSNEEASGILNRLIGREQVELSELGGVRGSVADAAVVRPPSPWLIPVNRTGIVCVRSGQPAQLWRPSASGVERFVVEDLLAGSETEIEFPDGRDTADWPAALAQRPAAQYLIRPSTAARSENVQLLEVPALPTPVSQALWLGARGCEDQARQIVARQR